MKIHRLHGELLLNIEKDGDAASAYMGYKISVLSDAPKCSYGTPRGMEGRPLNV